MNIELPRRGNSEILEQNVNTYITGKITWCRTDIMGFKILFGPHSMSVLILHSSYAL